MKSIQSEVNKKAFKFNFTNVDNNQIKYQFIKLDNTKLTYDEFIKLLSSRDKNFLEVLREALNHATSELSCAYFWECIPVSRKTINKPFEFVATRSVMLDNVKQNYSNFKEYIDRIQNNYVTSFSNLGGDSILIVPAPQKNDKIKQYVTWWEVELLNYKNLSKFTKNAPIEQQQALWQEVAEKLSEDLEKNDSETNRWLSTHGLGVSYLHVRIDSIPKYYSFEEYSKYEYLNPKKEEKHKEDYQSKKWDRLIKCLIYLSNENDWKFEEKKVKKIIESFEDSWINSKGRFHNKFGITKEELLNNILKKGATTKQDDEKKVSSDWQEFQFQQEQSSKKFGE